MTEPSLDEGPPLGLEIEYEPFRHRNVAVSSTFGFHFDVYMALVWTLQRVFKAHRQFNNAFEGTIQVFADQPFGFDFNSIINELALYDGSYKKAEELFPELRHGKIDLVIFGTCEFDLREERSLELLKIWDEREQHDKFTVVCIVHHVEDTAWQSSIADWARRDAIRILPISEHVARAFERRFLILADDHDVAISSAGWENIPIDVHVPILNVTIPHPSASLTQNSRLSNVVIQGSFASDRRDYTRIFNDLITNLEGNPKLWGYLPLNSTAYEVDVFVPDPFRLYLIGSGYIQIPSQLQNIVTVHTGLNYSEFYDLMTKMDLCLPAFAENGYYEQQASSTFVMSLECNVPLLVTRRMRQSYSYADDDRAVLTRPAAIRDVEAIRLLRTGVVDEGANVHVTQAERKMVETGWKRKDYKTWMDFKHKVWRDNERVIEKILQNKR